MNLQNLSILGDKLNTNSDIHTIAIKAFADAEQGDKLSKRARANATFVLCQSLDVPVTCYYQQADDTVVMNTVEPLRDLLDPEYVTLICGDKAAARTAVRDEIIFTLSGIREPSPAQRSCLADAMIAARGLVAKLGDATAEQVGMTSRGNLKVPFEIMHDVPKSDAPESEHDTYEARKGKPYTIDGSKGNSFAELRRRVAVKAPAGNDRAGAGQGKVNDGKDRVAFWTAQLKGAEYRGEKGEDWVAYAVDLSPAQLIEALVLYANVHDENGGAE